MDGEKKIPLVIGVTGHLNPRPEDTERLREAVKQELAKLQERVPHTPLVMLCPLARGADLLCAEAAEELGIPLRAALPMEQEEYEKDFLPEDLARMRRQAERAETVFSVPATEKEPWEEDRDFRYRQAGIYVAEHSHLLLALWDGNEENRTDSGTGAVVRCALQGAWKPRRGMACRNAENAAVLHIKTPRKGDAAEDAGEVRLLGNAEAMEEILERTEEFNRLAEKTDGTGFPLLPEAETAEPEMRKLEILYHTADRLSLRFAKGYRRTLGLLAVLGTIVAFTFLLYDEAELLFMMILCGAALACAILVTSMAKRSDGHRRYIEYRVLAETLRVQLYLRYAGSRTEAQRIMTWTQQQETPWILCAMCALNAGKSPEIKRDVRECWVENQRQYHEKAGKRTNGQSERNDRLLRVAAVCAVALYFVTLGFEMLCGGLVFAPVVQVAEIGTWRMVMKILLGTISTGTLFLASYYGKMSLERKKTDHRKMEAFFTTLSRQMEQQGQTEELLEVLAREELTENGNWSSYQRDNAPELNV